MFKTMIIRIFQILALSIVIAMVSSGILLAIWPELASITRDGFVAAFNKDSPPGSQPASQLIPPPNDKPAAKPKQKTIVVDSYEASAQHPLKSWTLMTPTAGHIDKVKKLYEPSTKQTKNLQPIIELSGWAGHSSLGMNFAHIVFSLCGKIVGSATVDSNRPDVAKSVHNNLLRSGWKSRLSIDHLPDCPNAELKAWGLANTGTILWPLVGKAIIKKQSPTPKSASLIIANKEPLHPNRATAPILRKIKIKPNRANLRQCASTNCKIVGKVKGGRHFGYIVENKDQWVLLQLKDGAGWMARRLFTDAPVIQ